MRFAGPRAKLIRFRFYYYYDSKLLSLVCIPLFSSLPFSLLVLYRSGRCAVATYTANTCNIVMRRLKYLNPCLCSSLWYSFSFSFFFIVSGFFFFTDTEKFVDGGKCQMYHCLYTDIHWPNNVRHPISLFSFFFIFSFTVSFIFSLHLLRDACYELYGASPDLSFWRETGVVSFFRLHFSCVDKKNKKVTRLSKCIVPYLSVSLSLSSSSSLPSKLSILALLVYICPRPGGDDRNYLFNTHSSDFHCFRCELFHYRPFSTMTWCRTD